MFLYEFTAAYLRTSKWNNIQCLFELEFFFSNFVYGILLPLRYVEKVMVQFPVPEDTQRYFINCFIDWLFD